METFLIFIPALLVFVGVALQTRGITFINARRDEAGNSAMTDQERQVLAAGSLKGWGWPSRIHAVGGGKTRMKDVGVLLTAFFQRLLGDKTTPTPLILACNLGTAASALLLYAAAAHYWNPMVAAFVSLLFLFCHWPHQITLTGGFHTVAQALFLASVVCMQKEIFWAAGACLAAMMFASAAARKFLPLFFGAFFWSQRDWIAPVWDQAFAVGGFLQWMGLSLLIFCLAAGAFQLLYPPLIRAAYYQRGLKILHGLLKSRDRYPLERYLELKNSVGKKISSIAAALAAYFLFCYALSRGPEFWIHQAQIGAGFLLVTLLLTAPNFLENLRGYFTYWYTPRKSCHFILYKDFFEKIGRPISEEMRGEGLPWVLLLFFRNTPFHFALYFFTLGALGLLLFFHPFSWRELLSFTALVFLSLSPVLYGEWTRSPQFARPYFPGLLGLLLLTGYGFFRLDSLLVENTWFPFWSAAWGFAGVSALWNAGIFFWDVLPARMAPTRLGKVLEKLPPKMLYTYETPYNDAFVNALQALRRQKYPIRNIQSLSEAKDGYILVPGTSSKSLNIEGYPEAIRGEDFRNDPLLNDLIESKKIEEVALARFKTYGTSKVWALDSEMPSYRQLILKDITKEDRWRSHGWILDATKLA